MTTLLPDFLVNLAASLAYDLLQVGADHLRNVALGDDETNALHRA